MNQQQIGCPICKHYDFDSTCAAFPDRIPMMFLSGERGHTEPIDGQQNDIVFEWISPDEQQQRVTEILAKFEHDAGSEKIPQSEKACT
jgi:hypothetical protein